MTRTKVLATAAAQVGVSCDPTTMDNKFNQWYYGGKVNNSALNWCVVFVKWVLENSGIVFCGGTKTASCGFVQSWAKTHGCFVQGDYEPGDLVLFDWTGDGKPQHIGIVESISGGYVYTIEGNTTNGAKKSCVAKKTRYLKNITGAYRPEYKEEPEMKWYDAVWKEATEKGIVDGTRPEDAVTRAEVVQILKNCGVFAK